jgi:two-component system chemotaxis sensor kinase CheA
LLAVGVDRLLDSEEALVRPLGPHLQGSRLYGGAVVLADGSIALLLDGAGVAATAGRAAADLDRLPRDESVGQPASGAEELLVAEVGDGRRLAVPINLVVRLLVADAGDLDRVGSWEVLRLGERILPLVRVPASLAPDCDRTSGDPIHVVVVRTDAEGDVGIVVDSFYDVGSAQMFGALDEQGLTAVTQVHGRMAGQLDVRAAVAQACGSMAELAEFALVGAP